MSKLDRRSRNNVPTNVKNIQHKENDGERENLNYSFRYRRIQCLKCRDFGHIQVECSSFSRKHRKIYHVTKDNIDEEGEFNQGNNVVTFKHMKKVIHTSE